MNPSTLPLSSFFLFSLLLISISIPSSTCEIFHVQKKKSNDHSNARILSSIESNTLPVQGYLEFGMYTTEIEIGNPSKNFTVHVDTGSSSLWVYCQDCKGCYTDDKSQVNEYDPKKSVTSHIVNKGEAVYDCRNQKTSPDPCPFYDTYLDGTNATGYYVTDAVGSKSTKTNFTFGCVTSFTGAASTYSEAGVEGILGFGDTDDSFITNLGAAGKVKKVFSHCLDNERGEGFFAIGEVVKPKVTGMVPFAPGQAFYGAQLTTVQIGDRVVDLKAYEKIDPTAVIDSGTSEGVLPDEIYDVLVGKINATLNEDKGHMCFDISKGDNLPDITFHFSSSVKLTVQPMNYVMATENSLCLLWSKGSSVNTNNFILGDIAYSKKLVVYDLEKKMLGWADHDCSSLLDSEIPSHLMMGMKTPSYQPYS